MISKLKYILLDFGNDFKNDFLNTLKKSIVLLIIGIAGFIFKEKADFMIIAAIIGLLGFGFIWARNLTSSLVNLSNITSNVVLKWTIFFITFTIGTIFGYIYFIWCLIKMIVVVIKQIAKK